MARDKADNFDQAKNWGYSDRCWGSPTSEVQEGFLLKKGGGNVYWRSISSKDKRKAEGEEDGNRGHRQG